MSNRRFVSRRQFLMGSGATLALPPLLSLMSPSVAKAAMVKPKRAVIMANLLGIDQQHLFPAEPISLTPVQGAYSVGYKPLSSFTGPVSRMIDADFAPMFPKMNLMQGLSLCGGLYQGHNSSILSGTHSGGRSPTYGKSVDVVLAQSSKVYGADEAVPHRAIRLRTSVQDALSFDRVNGAISLSSGIQGDRALFNTLFGGALPGQPSGPDAGVNPVVQQRYENDKLVVDRVYQDLKALESNPRLGTSDRKTVLEPYVQAVFELQQRVNANNPSTMPAMTVPGAAQCVKPNPALEVDAQGNGYQFPTETKWGVADCKKLFDNYNEMLRLAFVCDLTRVVFFQNGIYYDDPKMIPPGGLHHECPTSEDAADRQQWGLKRFLELAKTLDATIDPFGGGTVLDNSIMFWTNELGAWTTAHSTLNLPAVTFGGGGGYFRTGNFIDYRQKPLRNFKGYHPGRPYKQLLQSIMLSMGLSQSDYSAFGDGQGFGEFKPGINQFGFVANDAFTP
ncbi:MAG: DUF1552 domain-containing protein, partial [Myxococcaceae bacterium]|nr:DUF1552 domain-containing protein [Myxococcaceae bacterium]